MKLTGSIFIILSGLVPFIDNIWSWIDPSFNEMLDGRGVKLRSDIWIESIYVSIILVSIGGIMKPYKMSYFFPVYASVYSLAMYELMRFGFEIDPDWFHRIGFIIMFIPGFYVIYRLIEYIKQLRIGDEIQYKTLERLAKKTQNDGAN